MIKILDDIFDFYAVLCIFNVTYAQNIILLSQSHLRKVSRMHIKNFLSPAKQLVLRISEIHFGNDADHFSIFYRAGISCTCNSSNVVSTWSKWRYVPTKVVLDIRIINIGSRVVLIIQWGIIPVNMNVDIFQGHLGVHNTNQIESNVISFCDGIWSGIGWRKVQIEYLGIIIALLESYVTKIVSHCLSWFDKRLNQVFGIKEVVEINFDLMVVLCVGCSNC